MVHRHQDTKLRAVAKVLGWTSTVLAEKSPPEDEHGDACLHYRDRASGRRWRMEEEARAASQFEPLRAAFSSVRHFSMSIGLLWPAEPQKQHVALAP
jgi:hypothetical protein